jgi:hypothetical protein
MPNIPLRDIGKMGVISDRNPHDLPFEAWTDANNLRFARGVVSRYSVFKPLGSAYDYGARRPVGVVEAGGTEGDGYVVTVFEDGSMEQHVDDTTTDCTPAGTLGSSLEQITTCTLGSITYVNRSVAIPVYRENPSDGAFVQLPGWDVNDRCKSLRAYKDFLIALNVTKGPTNYPAMIKWSDAAQVGSPPDDWNPADLSSLAGENVLNECRGGLIDGLALGDTFIIYGKDQTFRMDYIGAPLIFRTAKVFDDQGMIAPNCAVAVEGKHYVFGLTDIYMHDGLSKVSISDGVVIERIMRELDFDNKDKCFVYHDQIEGEIGFCYPSISSSPAWRSTDVEGCNRAMVYNYRSKTWFPVDLPSIIGATKASVQTVTSWDEMSSGWDATGSTWSSFQGLKPRGILMTGTGNPVAGVPPKSYFLDDLFDGRLEGVPDPDVLWDAWGEMRYKDLDELGVELYGRKLVRSVDLQFGSHDTTSLVRFQLGQSRGANTPITWGRQIEFQPWQDTRYDCRINDRYLAMRLEYPAGTDADFGGFDADFNMIAKR